jgi:predicted ArsR family transcriptional regulator
MRVLVTGSRDWPDDQWHVIADALYMVETMRADPDTITLVQGNCPTGADRIAVAVARTLGWQIEAHPADWARLGKAAGPLRNAEMVDAGATLCLAFIKNGSKGATGCAELARKSGIETHTYTI